MRPDDAPPNRSIETPHCRYPEAPWLCLEYQDLGECSAEVYQRMLLSGWRRFGRQAFHTTCGDCRACRSLRVDVAAFRPNRSQRRVEKLNRGTVELRIGKPILSRERMDLYHRFHDARTAAKGWPEVQETPLSYALAFLDNPFLTWEWSYSIHGRLVGVGLVDPLRLGLSAIYFYHDPDEHRRSLGTWNVLCLIQHARELGLPHVYLGFHVPGSGSLAYKSTFRPNEVLDRELGWVDYLR